MGMHRVAWFSTYLFPVNTFIANLGKNTFLQTIEPSSNFLHSSFLFFPFETTGWTQECSRLESMVILNIGEFQINDSHYKKKLL